MSTKGRGYWDKGVQRHFKTGIDLRLVSGVEIEQTAKDLWHAHFMYCAWSAVREARVMDSVVSSSLPERCSVLNQTVYKAGQFSSGPLRLVFTVSCLRSQNKWGHAEHLYYPYKPGPRDPVKWKCLVNINTAQMMGCHMSYQTLMRPGSVFSSHSRRQMALNGLRQANPKLKGSLWGGREGGREGGAVGGGGSSSGGFQTVT